MNADFGIAFDGDFDRCFFFDEKGSFVSGEYIVSLLANSFLEKHPASNIVHDTRIYWNIENEIRKNGGYSVKSKTGHSYIKAAMRENNAIYGGEMSAHHYFRDFAFCDSGMIPWLLVAELVGKKNKSLSTLINDFKKTFQSSGEQNFYLKDPIGSIKKVVFYQE